LFRDKFEIRADTACRALVCANIQHPLSPQHGTSTLRVVSIGCGPGNDALGSVIWAAHQPSILDVHVDAFDFVAGWRGVVEAAAGALSAMHSEPEQERLRQALLAPGLGTSRVLGVSINFGLGDLRAPASEGGSVLEAVRKANVVMLMYVVHESRAVEFDLFPEVLKAAPVSLRRIMCYASDPCV